MGKFVGCKCSEQEVWETKREARQRNEGLKKSCQYHAAVSQKCRKSEYRGGKVLLILYRQ